MDVPGYALVTGAASGIGKECAKLFAKEGAAGMALVDLNKEALLAVKTDIETSSEWSADNACIIDTYELDVADEHLVDTVVKSVVTKFGRLDYVVNAAGIAFKHKGGAAFAETKDWQRVIDINLTGTFFVLRAAAKVMLDQEPIKSNIDGRPLQRGSIVNFSSILGLVGVPMSTAYVAAKHGVLGLTRTASEDYAGKGIRINAVCPGYIETPMTTKDPVVLEVMKEKVANDVPMGRMGRAQEIADAVIWLCGGRSSFVTGIGLPVDGGYTQR